MIILLVAAFMDLMDSTITNVALPAIQRSLGSSSSQLEWTLSGYMLAFATLLITGGRLGDIFGRRNMFILGVAGFTVASLTAALAVNGDMLVASRVAQGAFAGVMVPQVLSNIQVLYKPEERGPIFGILGAISALGSVSGLLIGGWMVTENAFNMGWRSVFLINVPVGVALAILARIFVPESRSPHPLKLDLLGVVLASSGVFVLCFALIEGRLMGWPWWIWAMLVATPILTLIFVLQQNAKQRRDGSPLLPMPLFRDHGFVSGLGVQIMFWLAGGTYLLIFSYYLQVALKFTPFETGLTIFAMTVGSMIATPIGTGLAKSLGRWLIVAGGLIQAGAFVWVIQLINSRGTDLTIWNLAPALAVAGVGMVFMIIPLMDIALATIPTEDAGAASGTFSTFQQVGFALGVALAGVVFFGLLGTPPTVADFKSAVTGGLWITVAAFLVGALCALFMPAPRRVAAAVTPASSGERTVHTEA